SDAYMSVSRSQRIPLDGLAVDVRLAKTVDVTIGGSRAVLVTSAETWGDALTQAGWALGPLDVLSVPAGSAPVDGQAVTITQVATRLVQKAVPLPYAVQRVSDATLYVGTTKV